MDNSPLENPIENRDEVRFSLSGQLPVSFRLMRTESAFEALFVDISSRGLGLLVDGLHVNIGDQVEMKSDAGRTYSFQVIWVKKTRMKGTSSELLRIGLHSTEKGLDLLQDFAETSLIDM